MLKAVGYARVSSKEQEESGYSIPAQIELIKSYAVDSQIRVVKTFKDSETAKRSGRTDFNNMLSFIKENEINLILVEKTDRLYRNFKDYILIDDLDVEVHLIKENQILSKDSKSHEKFIHGIKVLMAKNYIDNLSEEIKKGQFQAIKQGRWVYGTVRGYKYDHSSGHPILVPDQNADMIRDCFKTMAIGTYNVDGCRRFINKKYGAGIKKHAFHRLLRNHIYRGYLKVDSLPEIYKGIHEPLVSNELFFKVQNILSERKTHLKAPQLDNPDFPLRGFIFCSECGKPLTGSWSKGRSASYRYYRCRYCNMNVKSEILEDSFLKLLKSYEPEKAYFQLFEVIFKQVWENHKNLNQNFKSNLESQITKLEDKKTRIADLLIDGTLSKDMYKLKLQETETELHLKKCQMEDIQKDYDQLDRDLRFSKMVMMNLTLYWNKIKDLQFRRTLQKIVFPEGIEFDGTNCRTASIPLIFNYLQAITNRMSSEKSTAENGICRTAVSNNDFRHLTALLQQKVANGGSNDTNVEPIQRLKNNLISINNLRSYESEMKRICI
jgi:DNA invertase Pin-like site-specific DNA recombinase